MTMANRPGFSGVGVGFKAEHFDAILETRPDLGFFEIHAENYMGRVVRRTGGSRRSANATRSRCMASVCRSARPDRWTRRIWRGSPGSQNGISRP